MPVKELMQKFGISKRTVYYDMDKINDWLQDQQLKPVEYVRTAGFLLPEESRNRMPDLARSINLNHYYYSPKERKVWLVIHLISREEPLYLNDIADLLYVSRGTVNKELNLVKDELAAFRLNVQFDRKGGYIVRGEENDKRRALIHYLSQVLVNVSWKNVVSQMQGAINAKLFANQLPLYSEEHFSAIYRILAKCEADLDMEFTDEMVFDLALRLLLYANRLAHGERITMDEDEKQVLQDTPQYQAAVGIARELGDLFEIAFPEDEICYITIHLLGAKVNRMSTDAESDQVAHGLRFLTRKMIDLFQRQACVYFQNRDLMDEQLYVHMKPAYYRMKYGMAVDNPLSESIKSKYTEVFELTKKSVRPFEEFLEKKMDDHEIAYIAMHFGGWLRKQDAVPVRRKKAAIVCVNGVVASRILKIQLEQIFSSLDIIAVLSLRDYEMFTEDVAFFFSTVPLNQQDVPVFIVNPILTDRDKEQLLHQVNNHMGIQKGDRVSSVQALIDIVRKHSEIKNETGLYEEIRRYMLQSATQVKDIKKPALNELITRDTIRFQTGVKDWEEAIAAASEPLLDNGAIEPRYVEAMLEKVRHHGPYIVIAPGVAIAHAKPEEGVNELGMSMLRLKEGVAFSDEDRARVQLVLVLAAIDDESHFRALRQLTMMFRDADNRECLIQADTVSKVLQMVDHYSKQT